MKGEKKDLLCGSLTSSPAGTGDTERLNTLKQASGKSKALACCHRSF